MTTTKKKRTALAIAGVFVVSISVLVPQWYLALNPQLNLDWTDFVWAIIVPIILAFAFFGLGKQRVLLYAFLAYIWSVSDDAPVYLDSVFTWPEVTSGLQHEFLEILLHVLTAIFLYLALREALKRREGMSAKLVVYALGAIAFLFSYAQNIPSSFTNDIGGNQWYKLDIVEHIVSLVFFSLAWIVASKFTKRKGKTEPIESTL